MNLIDSLRNGKLELGVVVGEADVLADAGAAFEAALAESRGERGDDGKEDKEDETAVATHQVSRKSSTGMMTSIVNALSVK